MSTTTKPTTRQSISNIASAIKASMKTGTSIEFIPLNDESKTDENGGIIAEAFGIEGLVFPSKNIENQFSTIFLFEQESDTAGANANGSVMKGSYTIFAKADDADEAFELSLKQAIKNTELIKAGTHIMQRQTSTAPFYEGQQLQTYENRFGDIITEETYKQYAIVPISEANNSVIDAEKVETMKASRAERIAKRLEALEKNAKGAKGAKATGRK